MASLRRWFVETKPRAENPTRLRILKLQGAWGWTRANAGRWKTPTTEFALRRLRVVACFRYRIWCPSAEVRALGHQVVGSLFDVLDMLGVVGPDASDHN